MKKFIYGIAFLSILFATACDKEEVDEQPRLICGVTCVDGKVPDFANSSDICDSTASVKVYQFLNQSVYVFDKGTCGADFTQTVINQNCDTLGYLGGISGNDIISGQSFSNNAVYQYTLWSN